MNIPVSGGFCGNISAADLGADVFMTNEKLKMQN
jgi:hypothetical protein